MHIPLTYALTLLPLVWGKTIEVNVGQNGLTFSPNNIVAEVGDKVDFHFFPKNHSVVQSSFDAPCVPISPGIFSGFQPTAAESKNVFEVTVNDTKPIWIYCAQGKHCQSGMSLVINEPKNNKTLAAYQQASKSVPASVAGPAIAGGIFLTSSSSSSNSTSTSSGSASGTGSAGSSSTSPISFAGTAPRMDSMLGLSAGLFLVTAATLLQF